MTVIGAAMLRLVEETGEGVLVLVDGLHEDEFRRSRLTRGEVERLLRLLADTLASLPPAVRSAMPELDWAGWNASAVAFQSTAPAERDDALWFAARSLVPATLSWLRVYRREQPGWFAFTA